jgi:hypothetical protein
MILQKRQQYSSILQGRDTASGSVRTAESALRAAERKPDRSEEQIAQVIEAQKSDARHRAETSIKMAVCRLKAIPLMVRNS